MRVWTPCEVWRHARLAVTYASRCAPLASYSHVRAWPPVLRLRGFPRLCSQSPCSQPRDSPRPCCHSPCFRRLCSQSLSSRLPYLLRLYSRSLCSQLFDSPQLCSRWPCSPSLLSQWPCSLRPYFRWPLSRSRGPPPELRALLPRPCRKTRPAWPLPQPQDARDSPTRAFHGSQRQRVAVLIVLPSLACALREQRFLALAWDGR